MGIAIALEILSYKHLQMSLYPTWMLSLLRNIPLLSPQGYTLDNPVTFFPRGMGFILPNVGIKTFGILSKNVF